MLCACKHGLCHNYQCCPHFLELRSTKKYCHTLWQSHNQTHHVWAVLRPFCVPLRAGSCCSSSWAGEICCCLRFFSSQWWLQDLLLLVSLYSAQHLSPLTASRQSFLTTLKGKGKYDWWVQYSLFTPAMCLTTTHSPSNSRQMWCKLIPRNKTPSLSPHSTTRPIRPISPGSWPMVAQLWVTWYSFCKKLSNRCMAAPCCPSSSPSLKNSSCVSIATCLRTRVCVSAWGCCEPLDRAKLRSKSVPRRGVAGEWYGLANT